MVQYITGTPNEWVVNEVRQAIERAYPIREGRPFINTGNIITEINRSPLLYPLASSITPDRYQKTVVTHAIKYGINWKMYSKSRGSTSSSVFIREGIA